MAEPPSSLPANIPSSDSYDCGFKDSEARIILRSCDGILYRMHTFVLRNTSGFFRGMMTLPQSASSIPSTEETIHLDENSAVLAQLLRMISGLEFVPWEQLPNGFEVLESVVDAAYKYEMPGPMATIRATIMSTSYLDGVPLIVYTIAARYGWEKEAKIASRATLRLPILNPDFTQAQPRLGRIPSPYLLRLIHLHRRRRDEFQKLIVEDGKYFGLGFCGSCRQDTGAPWLNPLSRLADRMFKLMDSDAHATELVNGTWMTWPEMGLKLCTQCVQGDKPILHFTARITASINDALRALPDTI